MTLSEAVKAAGIGGKVRRDRCGDICVEASGLWHDHIEFNPSFGSIIADDWTVVQRSPREWTMFVGPAGGLLHEEQLGCHGSRCDRIRVREVVE
jgi:hypothetical protein